ncbi:MAG: phosphoglucosamine mutase [Blastopirellula sp.]|nr:MAG: phosphoglucosamine mutase [Blastopirellula sp.]
MDQPIISVSGLRGIVGQSLSPQLVIRYIAAFSQNIPPGPILLGTDGRPSGHLLAEIIRGSLGMLGRDVVYAGVCATPTVGVLTREHKCAGAIQISASHNPPEYNGLKLMGSDGRVISAIEGEEVLKSYSNDEATWVDHSKIGQSQNCEDTISAHCQLVLDRVDVEKIKQKNFNVLLDSNGGAGSILGKILLEKLGCTVTTLGDGADGNFLHRPEPTAENLVDVGKKTTELGADIGFCQDPDADRLAVIDETGRYIGEEYTLALCLENVLAKTPGPVVTNCATSRMNQDIAEKYGSEFHQSKVGEANVTGLMKEVSAVFGGEGNGGPIDPQVGLIRDSFVGMAYTLDLMASRQQPISQLANALPRYEIIKSKVTVPKEQIPAAIDAIEAHFSEAKSNREDGLRLDWDDRWLLIRASNTEPIVRVIAETKSAQLSTQLCEEAAQVIEKL